MRAEFWWWNIQDRGRTEDLGVDGRIGSESVAQDTEKLPAVLNAVMDLWVI